LTTAIIIIGLLLAILGLIGCVLPMVPGPPLGFAALIILSFVKNWEPFGTIFLFVLGGLTGLLLLLDYVVPALGAKKYGASKLGVWGSVIGVLVGLLAFPPFGMFVGGFAGAVVGELWAGKAGDKALRAGWGVFLGNLANTGLKMALSAAMLFFYIKAMF
jgi:uncharacterized protein YqgC (DUF456 family)